jgi:putative sterol carrier protein
MADQDAADAVLAGLRERISSKSPEQLKGSEGVYQVKLTGEGGADYVLTISESGASVEPGVAENPGVTATMAASDFKAMAEGRLNPMTAFMSGRLSIAGSMGLAMKLSTLLS